MLSKTATISKSRRIHSCKRKPYSTSNHWLEVRRQSIAVLLEKTGGVGPEIAVNVAASPQVGPHLPLHQIVIIFLGAGLRVVPVLCPANLLLPHVRGITDYRIQAGNFHLSMLDFPQALGLIRVGKDMKGFWASRSKKSLRTI